MRGLGKNRSLMLSLNILSKLVTRSISKYVIYKDANQMHIKFFLYIEGDSFWPTPGFVKDVDLRRRKNFLRSKILSRHGILDRKKYWQNKNKKKIRIIS